MVRSGRQDAFAGWAANVTQWGMHSCSNFLILESTLVRLKRVGSQNLDPELNRTMTTFPFFASTIMLSLPGYIIPPYDEHSSINLILQVLVVVVNK